MSTDSIILLRQHLHEPAVLMEIDGYLVRVVPDEETHGAVLSTPRVEELMDRVDVAMRLLDFLERNVRGGVDICVEVEEYGERVEVAVLFGLDPRTSKEKVCSAVYGCGVGTIRSLDEALKMAGS